MFTGIVQEKGTVRDCDPAGKAVRFVFDAPLLAPKLAVGDSVACDGVCLTVERLEPLEKGGPARGFSACAVPETLARTTLGAWNAGVSVNLEPALTPSTPMGGHFVLGHVDGVCEVIEARALGAGEGRELRLRPPAECLRYCARKGSLTLAGVSLTIASVEADSVRVAIIPHTLAATTLGSAKAGDRLNFEADILAKYAERLLGTGAAATASALPEQALREWGHAVS
jgi:riboflavin synthase